MKIEKRYIVGGLMLIPFLPLFVLGFVAYWLRLYAEAGYDLGESLWDWTCRKVGAE